MLFMIDTHCHLTDKRLASNIDAVLDRARKAGVRAFLCAASSATDSEAAAALAASKHGVYCTAGIHPHDASRMDPADLDRIESLAENPRCVAIGEIGLDYHYGFSPRPSQKQVFASQLQLAARIGTRVVIHTREAFEDTMSVLMESEIDMTSVLFHSFAGEPGECKRILDSGASISFSGIVTFKNAPQTRQAAAMVPDDRILAETDCPYLSPEPVRKEKINEPSNLIHVVRRLAELRKVPLDGFRETLVKNAGKILGLHPA